MNIDAHQHYWDPSRGDYGWLTPALDDLYRVFGPDDLMPLTKTADIQRTVVVQAAPTLAETRYLMDLARDNDSIAGVVGWVPLDVPEAPTLIREFAQNPKFKGVRPMLQDLPDDRWIAEAPIDSAIRAVVDANLSFDALVYTRHLPALQQFAERYPTLRIVVDHAAKPPIRDIEGKAEGGEQMSQQGDSQRSSQGPIQQQTQWQEWANAMASVAALPQRLHCKISGLATEAGPEWTADTLRPYIAHLMMHFGPSRLLWGSDWPVLNRNGDYLRWHRAAQTLIGECAVAENAARGAVHRRSYGTHDALADAQALAEDGRFGGIFGANARRFYRL